MPSIIHSPSVKFKLIFCATCSSEIKNENVKCDECRKSFHISCAMKTDSELIWLCNNCNNEKKICTKKDQIEIKSAKKANNEEINNNERIKTLRSRTISVDTYNLENTQSKTKKTCALKTATTEDTIRNLTRKIKNLEDKLNQNTKHECDCKIDLNARISKIESIINAEQKNQKQSKQAEQNTQNSETQTGGMTEVRSKEKEKKKKKESTLNVTEDGSKEEKK